MKVEGMQTREDTSVLPNIFIAVYLHAKYKTVNNAQGYLP
jgi:hypothetical protein